MADKPIQIVDENDQPLRAGTMEEAQQKGLWHRIVRVLVEDEKACILLQKRSATMVIFPNCWDTSAAGHVDYGEDYVAAAKRETFEEIGVKDIPLKEISSYKSEGKYKDKTINRFNRTYRMRVPANQQFVADPEEVDSLEWFTREEIKALFRDHPGQITDGLKRAFLQYP